MEESLQKGPTDGKRDRVCVSKEEIPGHYVGDINEQMFDSRGCLTWRRPGTEGRKGDLRDGNRLYPSDLDSQSRRVKKDRDFHTFIPKT